MAAVDIGAQVLAWAMDEAGKQAFTEEFGVSVTWTAAPVQTPQGVIAVPGWQLLITFRNPLVGQGDLFHMVPAGTPRPKEADVRSNVTDGMAKLRDLAASKLSGSNGKAPAKAGRG
jgi:hypothetical protein